METNRLNDCSCFRHSQQPEHVMAKSSITQMKGKTVELTAEAGKIMRQGALDAAHRAVMLARKTVQSADQALQEALPGKKRRKSRIARLLTKKPTRKAAKAKARPRSGWSKTAAAKTTRRRAKR
jgi:hypothetical protein